MTTTSPLRCYGCGETDDKCCCWSAGPFPEPHRNWLKVQVAMLSANHDCVTNIRVARECVLDETQQYAEQFAKGCCGEFDTYVSHPDGTRYMIGFNYGH